MARRENEARQAILALWGSEESPQMSWWPGDRTGDDQAGRACRGREADAAAARYWEPFCGWPLPHRTPEITSAEWFGITSRSSSLSDFQQFCVVKWAGAEPERIGKEHHGERSAASVARLLNSCSGVKDAVTTSGFLWEEFGAKL